jgi:hypothetical protein
MINGTIGGYGMQRTMNTFFAIVELLVIFVIVGLFFALVWQMKP